MLQYPMKYVALLRGINVGGNSKVDMKTLKIAFEDVGLENVKTYINSGNVLFADSKYSSSELVKILETKIEEKFGFHVKVLVKSHTQLKKVVDTLPDTWVNDAGTKCDVMFLWEDVDSKKIIEELPIKPEIDTIKYVAGALLWCVKRKDVTKSGMLKIIGTKLYKQMTIRNCNTARKLLALMDDSSTKQ